MAPEKIREFFRIAFQTQKQLPVRMAKATVWMRVPKTPKIPLLYFEIPTVQGGVFLGFWAKKVTCRAHDPISVRIDSINGQMGPKNQKVVVWGARI
jgi:hypothetical protein